MIPASKWKWFGFPGHFIGSDSCGFRLCTAIGEYLVSTVGDYHPMNSKKAMEIGCGRKYETYVFALGEKPRECKCGCGMPIPPEYMEIDAEGSNSAVDATRSHMDMCLKWAKKQSGKKKKGG